MNHAPEIAESISKSSARSQNIRWQYELPGNTMDARIITSLFQRRKDGSDVKIKNMPTP
jgi:hypothetical protein